jgi:hypothetical protein
MTNLLYKVNDLILFENLYIVDYANFPNYDMRKNEIMNKQISYFDKELDILKDILILTQNLYDFILLKKIDDKINQKSKESKDYMYFLEIRGCIFVYLDIKNDDKEIYESLTDRRFAEWNNKKLSQKMTFYSQSNTKQNLFFKGFKEATKKLNNNHSFMENKTENKHQNIIDKTLRSKASNENVQRLTLHQSEETSDKKTTESLFLTNILSLNNESQKNLIKLVPSTRFKKINDFAIGSHFVDMNNPFFKKRYLISKLVKEKLNIQWMRIISTHFTKIQIIIKVS